MFASGIGCVKNRVVGSLGSMNLHQFNHAIQLFSTCGAALVIKRLYEIITAPHCPSDHCTVRLVKANKQPTGPWIQNFCL